MTFDVDGSGLIQNIQPSWGANGAGTSTLNITGPEVHYGFFGNTRTSLVGLNGPGHKGWDSNGDHVETSIWPVYTGRSYTWRHNDAPDPPAGEIHYLSFRMNENAEVYDIQPETAGKFAIDSSGKATLDTDDGGLECGGSYVIGAPSLVDEQSPISATVIAAINTAVADLQSQIDNVELTPGPAGDQGAQGKAGADGANGSDGSQGPQGKAGADGANAPCVDCQAISDAAFNLACIQLAASPATTVSDFQSSVDALATVAVVGSGSNICEPIPGGAATCMDYINDQAQAIYDSK
ncbi:MAG TPA: hypothetical protein DIT01_19055 [Lentisphaeria bacterium]|nr:hypothetical protein [Lentisphaeria bacterium]